MNNISEAIINYLNMKTTVALFLTGAWGSGKTYHVKNNVFPLIEKETEFIPVIVSLYGETDKNNIAQKVLFSFFDKKGESVNLSTGTLTKNIKKLSDAIPALKKYVDLEKLIVGTGENVFKLLPHDKLLICFDDLERMSSEIDVNDFLGIVNELVENKACKVLLIANEEKIKNGITFKEKTIDKTIHFTSNISLVLDNIIDSYSDESSFKEYLTKNKQFIIETLNPHIENISDLGVKDLKKTFSNIRSLKFAIEHFKYSYLIISKLNYEDEKLREKQLKNLWLFTLFISMEFRKPNNISFTERKGLDEYSSDSIRIDMQLNFAFGEMEPEDTEIEKEWISLDNFREIYYDRFSETYIYHPAIYNLITSGKVINEKEFAEHLDKSFNIQEGKVNPAHALLNSLSYSNFSSFSNSEFKKALENLLSYCKKGQLDNIWSYLDAASNLFWFNEILGVEKAIIIEQIKEGLGIFLSTLESIRYEKTQFYSMLRHSKIDRPDSKNLIEFIKSKFEEIERQNAQKEDKELEEMFESDFNAFVDRFLPYSSDDPLPYRSFFHKFNRSTIDKALKPWQAKEIIGLNNLLYTRYLAKELNEGLADEMQFLQNIENIISDFDLSEKSLSTYLFQNELLLTITKCKQKLQSCINKNKETLEQAV